MTDKEAKNAFNQNMMTGGVLSDGPAEFARENKRRWLVTAYEAGDVVLHSCYAVRDLALSDRRTFATDVHIQAGYR